MRGCAQPRAAVSLGGRGIARLFVAIELPDAARAACARAQDELRPRLPKASFPPPENLHCTVAFLGDVDDVDAVCDALRAVGVIGSVPTTLSGLGAFPSRARARVVWAGLAGEIEPIAGAVQRVLGSIGFEMEERPFRAHVTLARMRVPARVELEATVDEVRFTIDHITLMRSVLRGSKHPVYEPVHVVPLGA